MADKDVFVRSSNFILMITLIGNNVPAYRLIIGKTFFGKNFQSTIIFRIYGKKYQFFVDFNINVKLNQT